jgi:hypothetical protein
MLLEAQAWGWSAGVLPPLMRWWPACRESMPCMDWMSLMLLLWAVLPLISSPGLDGPTW